MKYRWFNSEAIGGDANGSGIGVASTPINTHIPMSVETEALNAQTTL